MSIAPSNAPTSPKGSTSVPQPQFKLDRMSFYWRTASRPLATAEGIPDFLPFEFGYNPAYGLIVQKHDAGVSDALNHAYLQAENVGYLQDGHALAASYGGDFLEFIGGSAPHGSRVLEIGCGGGYILQRLREKGFAIRGIDPSPIAVAKGKEHSIEIIEEFYPCDKDLTNSCDVMIHYDVLEHVYDPLAFLKAHHAQLSPGGMIAFAVPDCTESVEQGDLSMVIHEHINYFDMKSLRSLVEAAGFTVDKIERAKHGGVLFCAARRGGAPVAAVEAGPEKFTGFIQRLQQSVASFRRFSERSGGDLGIYIPLRAVPYLAAVDRHDGLRFFDDDPGCHRKYLAGYAVPVENFDDFLASPPSHLFIASLAFADRIKAKVRERLGDGMTIMTLRELFPGQRPA